VRNGGYFHRRSIQCRMADPPKDQERCQHGAEVPGGTRGRHPSIPADNATTTASIVATGTHRCSAPGGPDRSSKNVAAAAVSIFGVLIVILVCVCRVRHAAGPTSPACLPATASRDLGSADSSSPPLTQGRRQSLRTTRVFLVRRRTRPSLSFSSHCVPVQQPRGQFPSEPSGSSLLLSSAVVAAFREFF
jgi:hypothetical protein